MAQTDAPTVAAPGQRTKLAAVVVAVFVVAALLYVVLLVANARTRRPWNDEAMFADAAFNLAFKGFMGLTVMENQDNLPNLHRYMYFAFPLYMVILAAWYKVVGFSLMAMRVMQMGWTVLFLWEWWVLLKFWSRKTGIALLGTALIALEYNVMIAASFGRYEPMVGALGFGAYCCYLVLRERHLALAILAANACVTAAGTTHPNGLMFFLGLWFLILYLDRRRLQWKHLAVAAIPYAAGAALWGIYILKSPQSFLAQLHANSYSRFGLFAPIHSLKLEWDRYMTTFGFGEHSAGSAGPIRLKMVVLVVYVLCIVAFLSIRELRKNKSYVPLLMLTAIHFLYQCFIDGFKLTFYLFLMVPLYAAITAIVLYYLWERGPALKAAVAAVVMVLVALQVGGIAQRIRIDTYGRMYLPAVHYLQENAKASDLILASCEMGFGYGFTPNLTDDIRLGFATGKKPVYIVVEEAYQANFDYWKNKQPDLYEFIKNRLSREYDMVYDRESYRIYKRKPGV
ncbi:MAG TPA: hypothetical protein VLW65_18645 [Bryobacteraceae bacterium]|nr:hypothetical protein [Bryobacteraceae bacterium]